MNLSPHFTLEEFCISQTASRLGIDNDAPADLYPTLKRTAEGLELVRKLLNSNAIRVSSGYRCLKLNAALGSKETSQHVKGEAADFTCTTYGTPDKIIRAIVASDIPYDQVIREFDSWVHISFTTKPRRQALIIDHAGTHQWKA